MRTRIFSSMFLAAVVIMAASIGADAQKRPAATPKPAGKSVIFAVLNDGKMIEPIAFVEKGKLTETVDGSDDSAVIKAFADQYYKANSSYKLIFGASNAGTAAIAKAGVIGECAPNMAEVKVTTTRTTLKGKLMALATNGAIARTGTGTRRMPTWPERNEIDALVRAEFAAKQVEVKKLDYHNLTAMDVNGDKSVELIGSFWAENEPKSRTLLFFIAEKGTDGKYAMRFADFRTIKEEEVMSGEIASLDEGVYHELLLDAYDYDADGVAEIFTYVQSFEGAGFNAYKRGAAGWTRVFEGTNYHCGY